MIRQASIEGHKTTAYIMGIAASMASVIACACDVLKIDDNAFMMVHLPFSLTEGNAIDLRKEADTLDKFTDALLAIYRTKFDIPDSVIIKMMEDETWFTGEQAEMFNLNCEVIYNEEPLRAVALAKSMPKFLNTPKAIIDLRKDMENEELKEIEKLE
jgi:ATP-dependent protease ClpP protease subunit